jgi:Ca2+-binding RTX toxin-like protein
MLTGDSGGDVFVFAAGSGRDTVVDFGGGDIVAVDAALVLQGVSLGSLGAGDFSLG